MEKTRAINRRITKKRLVILGYVVPATVTEIFYSAVLISCFTLANTLTYARLYTNARHNEILRQQLISLKKENSSLEERKANLVNIREVQKKASELGFVHNNAVNYIK